MPVSVCCVVLSSADEQKSILDAIGEEEGGLLTKASTGLFSLLGGASKERRK
jgi:hypothetical protein